MRLLALLLLVSLTAHAQRFERFCGRTDQGRSSRGLQCDSTAFFSAFGADGLGTTTACSTTPPTGFVAGAPIAITTTRSTIGYCTASDYSLVSIPINTARVMTGGGSGLPLGLLYEFDAATNVMLQARDFSNASWTKTNVTCTKTATGWDGAANGASTCTATAPNGTVCQAVVVTGQHAMSLGIKRRTGTSAISIAPDTAATYFAVTSSLSSSIFKRVVNTETIGCMYGGCIVNRTMQQNFAASPTLCVRIANTGDAVDLDMAQLETGYFSTSPYPTTTVAAARGSETHTATVPAFTPRSLSFYSIITGTRAASTYNIAGGAKKDANNEVAASIATTYGPMGGSLFPLLATGGVGQAINSSSEISPTMGPVWMGVTNDGVNAVSNVAGVTTSIAATVQPPTDAVTIFLGGRAGGEGSGVISNFKADGDATKFQPTRNVAPNAVVWVGDSITAGSVSAPTMPPAELSAIIGKTVYNKGLPACNSANCASRIYERVIGKGYSTLVYSCGTNDLSAGSVPLAQAAFLVGKNAMIAAAASGMRVITTNILPEKKDASWNTNIQAAVDAYNADWAAWCATVPAGVTCLDAYAVFGGGTGGVCVGADPQCLLNAYDSGDGRHPNGVGSTALATLVSTANP